MFFAARRIVKYKRENIKVIQKFDTDKFEALDKYYDLVNDEDKIYELINSLFELSKDEIPKLIADRKIKTTEEKLTIYSLYK